MRRFPLAMDEEQARVVPTNLRSMGGEISSIKLSKYDKDNTAHRKSFASQIYRFCTLRTLLITVFIICVVDIVVVFVCSNSHSSKTAIIVLGGGLTDKGECPPHTQLRLDKALEIYNKKKSQGGAVIIPLSGGTPYKPNPVDEKGFPIWEATAAAKQLIKMGVPYSDILEEAFSLDTVGNVRLDTFPIRLLCFRIVTYVCPFLPDLLDCLTGLLSPHDAHGPRQIAEDGRRDELVAHAAGSSDLRLCVPAAPDLFFYFSFFLLLGDSFLAAGGCCSQDAVVVGLRGSVPFGVRSRGGGN